MVLVKKKHISLSKVTRLERVMSQHRNVLLPLNFKPYRLKLQLSNIGKSLLVVFDILQLNLQIVFMLFMLLSKGQCMFTVAWLSTNIYCCFDIKVHLTIFCLYVSKRQKKGFVGLWLEIDHIKWKGILTDIHCHKLG